MGLVENENRWGIMDPLKFEKEVSIFHESISYMYNRLLEHCSTHRELYQHSAAKYTTK